MGWMSNCISRVESRRWQSRGITNAPGFCQWAKKHGRTDLGETALEEAAQNYVQEMKETKIEEADYPWGQCISDQTTGNKPKSMDSAKKICGSIKAKYGETVEQSIMKQVLETKLSGCGCQKKKIS